MHTRHITKLLAGTLALASAGLAIGCHTKTADKAQFREALDRYYSARQDCLFSSEIKLPAQADAGNDDETKQFDALTDAGLMQRTPQEKKRFLIGSKQVNDYDLSEMGRTHWIANASQPGFGNFCLGAPTVQSIDNFVPAGSSENQYSVTFRYALKIPDWAKNAEIATAFPRTAQESAGRTATATLIKQGDDWQVGEVTSSNGAPMPQ